MGFRRRKKLHGVTRTTFVFVCDWSLNTPHGVSAKESPPNSLHYEITIATSGACAITPKGLSWGWLSIILGGVALVVYFVGGAAYNAKVRAAPEAEPEPERRRRGVQRRDTRRAALSDHPAASRLTGPATYLSRCAARRACR